MASTLKLGKGNWGVKEDSLLAYSDQNNNFIPLPFDFSRASSATVVNKAGLVESVTSGLPRIDFSDDTNGALLLEPESTNLITQSEDFGGGFWGNYKSTITDNQTTAPDGLLTASKFSGTSDVTAHTLYLNAYPVVSGNDYTYSVFAKKNENNFIQINTGQGFGNLYANFDLDNGVVGSFNTLDANIKPYLNGWFKCSVKANSSTGTGQSTFSLIQSLTDVRNPSFNALNNSVYIWGAQLEQQSYATSYIPTAGATATRVQDSCLKTNVSEIIGQTEGTFVMDFNYSHNQINVPIFETSTTNSNIYALALSDFKIRFWITLSGSNQVLLTTPTIPSEGRHKLAVAYKQNDSCFYLDGVFVGNDTNCSIPAVSELYLNKFNADVFEFTVFKERLSNAELEALTTI
jgi:hypothetical protein